jgi:hypothetical protein
MAGEVEFTPSEDDYATANREWYRRQLRRGWAKFLIVAGAGGAAVGAILGLVDEGPDPLGIAASAFTYALIPLVVGPVVYGFCYLAVPRRARRLYRQNKNLQRPMRYAWSEEGLSYASSTGTGKVAWTDLHRWSEGGSSFLFLLTDAMFHFIPKRAFAEAEAEDLRSTAARSGLGRL